MEPDENNYSSASTMSSRSSTSGMNVDETTNFSHNDYLTSSTKPPLESLPLSPLVSDSQRNSTETDTTVSLSSSSSTTSDKFPLNKLSSISKSQSKSKSSSGNLQNSDWASDATSSTLGKEKVKKKVSFEELPSPKSSRNRPRNKQQQNTRFSITSRNDFNNFGDHKRARDHCGDQISAVPRRSMAPSRPSTNREQDILMWGRPRPARRNVDVRMEHLKFTPQTTKWLKQLRISTWLLIGVGGLMIIGTFILSSEVGRSIYFRMYVIRNVYVLWLLVICTVQPILTGAYSFFAISYPESLRAYYLRASLYVTIPIVFVIGANVCMIILWDGLKTDLTTFLNSYEKDSFSRDFWDYVQRQVSCCGINSYKDWELLLPASYRTNGAIFPASCCIQTGDDNCLTSSETDAWQRGCFPQIFICSLWIGFSLLILALAQIGFQACEKYLSILYLASHFNALIICTIILSKRLYKYFEEKLKDRRPTMEIYLGSLCRSSREQAVINDEDIQYSFPWLRRNPHRRY